MPRSRALAMAAAAAVCTSCGLVAGLGDDYARPTGDAGGSIDAGAADGQLPAEAGSGSDGGDCPYLYCTGFDELTDVLDWTWHPGQSGPTFAIDTTVARSGNASMHLHQPATPAASWAFLQHGDPRLQGAANVYIRAWVRFGALVPAEFLALASPANQDGVHLYLRDDQHVGVGSYSNDGLLVQPSNTDPVTNFVPPTAAWACVELQYSLTQKKVSALLAGQTYDANLTSIDPKVDLVAVEVALTMGGALGKDADVWFDDLAYATQPIGCN